MSSLSFFEFFRQSVIRDFDIPVHIEEDVLWFQVSVNEPEIVKILDSEEDLGCIELGSIL